jgi:hypothetical protein
MRPTEAEIARTLARTRHPATLYLACRPGPWEVRQATDCAGRPLLLARPDEPVAAALRPRGGADDIAVAVCVEDRPPMPGAPHQGKVWVSGWASRVVGDVHQRAAAVEFAEANPLEDLLDIDNGVDLYQVEVREVRLETADTVISIDPEEYTAADPDPLREMETDLIIDLNDHHGEQIRPYLTRRLREQGVLVGANPQALRMDRYGFVVTPHAGPDGPGGEFVRVPFPRPVIDQQDLARVMHPVLFPHDCAPNREWTE